MIVSIAILLHAQRLISRIHRICKKLIWNSH